MNELDKFIFQASQGEPTAIGMLILLTFIALLLLFWGIAIVIEVIKPKPILEEFRKPPEMPEPTTFWVFQDGIFLEEGNCMRDVSDWWNHCD